jgi:3-hydroxybutyryl-CoA dehydrogenase
MQRIAVLGAGRMGCGIAQVFCAAGHPVALFDALAAPIKNAPAVVRSMFELLQQDLEAVERLSCTGDFDVAVTSADVVIEAVPERLNHARTRCSPPIPRRSRL